MEIKDTVLVVIDMQKGFLNDDSDFVIPRVVDLIKEFRERSMPVIFTRFLNVVGSPYENLIGWKGLIKDEEIDLAEEIQPYADIVINKNFYTSLTDEFCELAEKRDWKTFVICGVSTESCVLKTAVDIFENNLVPIVVADACASDSGEAHHEAGLLILTTLIGRSQIVSTSDLLSGLEVK